MTVQLEKKGEVCFMLKNIKAHREIRWSLVQRECVVRTEFRFILFGQRHCQH